MEYVAAAAPPPLLHNPCSHCVRKSSRRRDSRRKSSRWPAILCRYFGSYTRCQDARYAPYMRMAHESDTSTYPGEHLDVQPPDQHDRPLPRWHLSSYHIYVLIINGGNGYMDAKSRWWLPAHTPEFGFHSFEVIATVFLFTQAKFSREKTLTLYHYYIILPLVLLICLCVYADSSFSPSYFPPPILFWW